MREYLLYAAGPIRGVSYDECTDWRKYVAKRLPKYIKLLSPMRAKEYLAHEKSIAFSYEDKPLSSSRGIVCRDRFDVQRCDAILVNLLGAKKVSIGSVGEIFWADVWRKPIILVIEKRGNVHEHAMVRELSGFIVDNLDEAIKIAIAVLSPTP